MTAFDSKPAGNEQSPPKESAKRSLAKTISWRALASITTAIIGFSVMLTMRPEGAGEIAKASGVIGAFEVPSKLLLYYLHERAWARLRWGWN